MAKTDGASSLADSVCKQLRADILGGRLRVGQRLKLAEQHIHDVPHGIRLVRCIDSSVIAAASLFDLPSGDQSVARLVAPFAGDSAGGQIATLFGGLNAAILFLGSLVAGYGILSGIAQTAHDGIFGIE